MTLYLKVIVQQNAASIYLTNKKCMTDCDIIGQLDKDQQKMVIKFEGRLHI